MMAAAHGSAGRLPLVIRPPALNPTRPAPAVVQRLRRLPLHTLEEVRARFPDVPIEVAERGPHFPSLRLLTTSTCRMRCQYPGEDGLLWCHNEGLERNGIPAADWPTMLQVVAHLRARYGIREVVLAGLQPRLDEELVWFIGALHAAGIDKVSMTSHGLKLLDWLPRLREAGLDALVLSVQGFSRQTYWEVMGVDAFANALAVVELAGRLGLTVAVNRVVVRGQQHDIPAFLDWIRRHDLWVRLYDLMWNPGHDEEFLRHHISWQELIPLWEPAIERIRVWDWTRSGRINLLFELTGGGRIETNTSTPMSQHDAEVCQSCPVNQACTEGWLGCGIRVTPDFQIQPCLWRRNLRFPLLPLLERGPEDPANAALDAHLLGNVSVR
ncbi:MAG TPA: radical SAM protein [Actinomycetes bacterium]|jgi:molybdenum cofactor biosynthesis enzyme MoaA|nr:radical SAM protein [Actinomycetes bacterium]